MGGYSIKEAASELMVSDTALYKRISSKDFNTDFLTKINGKTIISEDGLNHLKSVVKKRKTSKSIVENEVALTLDIHDKDTPKLYDDIDAARIKVYTQSEIDIVSMLKDQVNFLRGQLEEQNLNFQEQLNLQAQSYQDSLQLQLDTIKSKDALIFSLQEIIKAEQANTKKLLDYDERSRELDDKLSQIRKELMGRRAKKKKGLFSFL